MGKFLTTLPSSSMQFSMLSIFLFRCTNIPYDSLALSPLHSCSEIMLRLMYQRCHFFPSFISSCTNSLCMLRLYKHCSSEVPLISFPHISQLILIIVVVV